MLERLDMGKIYIAIIALSVLLAGYFLFNPSGSGAQGSDATATDAATSLNEQLSATATSWLQAFYTTDKGEPYWLDTLKSLSTPGLAMELETAAASLSPAEQAEYLKRAFSFIEAGKEQFVTITLYSLKQKDNGYQAVLDAEERSNTVLTTQEYLMELTVTSDGVVQVASVYVVDTSGL